MQFIDKIERGFDCLGFHFGIGILEIAEAIIERFVAAQGFSGISQILASNLGCSVLDLANKVWRSRNAGSHEPIMDQSRYALAFYNPQKAVPIDLLTHRTANCQIAAFGGRPDAICGGGREFERNRRRQDGIPRMQRRKSAHHF